MRSMLMLTLTCLLVSQPFATSSQASEIETIDLDSLVAEVAEDVQSLAGAKLKALPSIKLYNEDHIVELIGDVDFDHEEARATVGVFVHFDLGLTPGLTAASSFLGYFQSANHKILLNKMVISNFCKELKNLSGDCDLEKLVKVIVGHELVHALQSEFLEGVQNKYYAIKQAYGDEAAEAYGAIVEGHAIMLEEELAELWQLDLPYRKLSETIFTVAGSLSNEGLSNRERELAEELNERVRVSRLGGRDFVRHQLKVLRNDGLTAWDLLLHPPRTMQDILQPSLYSHPADLVLPFRQKFAGLSELLSNGVDDTVYTPEYLHSELRLAEIDFSEIEIVERVLNFRSVDHQTREATNIAVQQLTSKDVVEQHKGLTQRLDFSRFGESTQSKQLNYLYEGQDLEISFFPDANFYIARKYYGKYVLAIVTNSKKMISSPRSLFAPADALMKNIVTRRRDALEASACANWLVERKAKE